MQTTFINEKIKDFLEKEKGSNQKLLFQLTLYIYSLEAKEHDLYLLARILSPEDLMKIVSYYDGDFIRLPKKENFFKLYMTAICMYCKEILQLEWKDIKNILNLPTNELDQLSAISIGRNINNIKEKFSKDIYKILNGIDLDEKGIRISKKEIEKMFKKVVE